MATRHAEPKMDPGITNLQAVFTAVGAGRYFLDLIEMCASHDVSVILSTDYGDFTDKKTKAE